ncbi:MAG: hypothetical protein COV67_05490 [Nitrospinae bacterium CG11_big_fil_rev_8_21_14_0_20_56_8]|nr:MAG: hypothetical protein COV67_05490 [Nitrospinae bacterium CG11_big_fil_rev_8_21_14_0_20_56_8]
MEPAIRPRVVSIKGSGNHRSAPLRRSLAVFAGAVWLLLFSAAPSGALPREAMIPFSSIKEAVAQMLPSTGNLIRRDIVLDEKHLARLSRFKNWDTEETEFVIYHSRNAENKVTGTLILFPEHTRQGTLVVAVALDNHGRVTGARLVEAQEPTVQWVLPLLRANYLDRFKGATLALDLALPKEFKGKNFSSISQTYARRLANSVKKTAQMFDAVYK